MNQGKSKKSYGLGASGIKRGRKRQGRRPEQQADEMHGAVERVSLNLYFPFIPHNRGEKVKVEWFPFVSRRRVLTFGQRAWCLKFLGVEMDGDPGRDVPVSFDRVPLRFRPGIIDIGEGVAIFKGPITDVGHAGGDGDGEKGVAAIEGLSPDGDNAIGNGDRGEGITHSEGRNPN